MRRNRDGPADPSKLHIVQKKKKKRRRRAQRGLGKDDASPGASNSGSSLSLNQPLDSVMEMDESPAGSKPGESGCRMLNQCSIHHKLSHCMLLCETCSHTADHPATLWLLLLLLHNALSDS